MLYYFIFLIHLLIRLSVYFRHNISFVQKRGRHVREDGAEPHRVLKHDMIEGKRTQADIVLRQFYRLHWYAFVF